MRSHVEIAVIGGGVVGCSVLYHLAMMGNKDCVLLEKNELTSGSTWHAAGGIHTHNSDVNMSKLQKYTIDLYKELEEISGQDCGVHLVGGIMVADTKERFDFLKLAVDLGRTAGIERHMVSMDEAQRMFPLIQDKSHFYGAMYEPDDGHLDPSSVTNAYAKAARKKGAQIYRHTKVIEIIPEKKGGFKIVTNKGNMHAQNVVNAGGLWAREVGRMVGIELPILAMEHHYLVTDDIPQLAELFAKNQEIVHCVDFGAEIYMRQEQKGLLLGTYEKQATPWAPYNTPWDFEHQLLPNNLERIEPSIKLAYERYPAIASVGIKKIINGPFTFSPDSNPLLGPVRSVPGYWCACAVMAGFSQGGGVGLALANWIINKDPGIDIFAMDVARFGDFATLPYTNKKVKENYSRRFSITYPTEELNEARNVRCTAIYQEQKQRNAVFTVNNGLEQVKYFAPKGQKPLESHSFKRSNSFKPVADEVKNIREKVGLFDISGFAKYQVRGKAAQKWLDTLLANKLPENNRIILSPMLNNKGNIIGDFTVTKLGEDHFMLFGSGACENFHMRIFQQDIKEKNIPQHDIIIESLFAKMHGLSISGPLANELLQKICYQEVDKDKFKFLDFKPLIVGNIPTLTGRISFTGEMGYEIWVDPDRLLPLYKTLCFEGKQFELQHFGSHALQSMRLEKSFGAYLHEYRPDYNPLEADIDKFVSKKKTNYNGYQEFKNIRLKKQKKKLVTMEILEAQFEAHPYMPLLDHKDKLVGYTTSGGYGHYINKSLALGYVDTEYATIGTKINISMMMDKYQVQIIDKSPFDPQAKRMRQV